MIPVMADRAVPESVTGPSLRIAPPSPRTNIALAMIRYAFDQINTFFDQDFQTVAGDNPIEKD